MTIFLHALALPIVVKLRSWALCKEFELRAVMIGPRNEVTIREPDMAVCPPNKASVAARQMHEATDGPHCPTLPFVQDAMAAYCRSISKHARWESRVAEE